LIKSDVANGYFNARSLFLDPEDPGRIWAAGEYQGDQGTVMAMATTTVTDPQWVLIDMPTPETTAGSLYDAAVSRSDPLVRWACGHFQRNSSFYPALYRSDDGGQTWSDLSDRIASIGDPVCAVDVDPIDPDVAYITSEMGLFRTSDAGQNWSYLGWFNAMTVIVDPIEPGMVWVGTRSGGVGLSRNGGQDWQTVTQGLPAVDLMELSIDPVRPWLVYASTDGGGIYRVRVDDHPAPVQMPSLLVRREGRAAVLRWQMQDLSQTGSFHVYREVPTGSRLRLTDFPLSGQGSFVYVDEAAPLTETRYWLQDVTTDHTEAWYGPLTVPGIEYADDLGQNHPNPFNPATTIHYNLAAPTAVSLRIFDLSGRLVRTLVNERSQSSGQHEVVWSGRDDGGRAVGSGVYVYTLQTDRRALSRRMILLK
jgi:hypothetical protein